MCKGKIISVCLMLCSLGMLSAQDRADRQNLEDKESFSMIVLGDPQSMVKYDINQPLFELQTAWIEDNIEHLNIKAVLCTGDLVEQNDLIVPSKGNGNQTSRQQWEFVSRAFSRLDHKVPYIISTGNHDYGYKSSEHGMSHFSEYFNVERNNKLLECAVATYSNRMGYSSLENAAFEFDHPKWGKILIVCNEFAPRDEFLAWTRQLISSDKYKNHKVIYLTHSFLFQRSAERTKQLSDGREDFNALGSINHGEDIWRKLVEPSKNIVLVICGHTGTLGGFEESVAYRKDQNIVGRDVHQMMFNVQTLGGGWQGNGSDGWLRILEFMPDGKTIKVRTYSPLFGISPATKHLAHRTELIDQFEMVVPE